ncbi:MAG: hypothetical protein IKR93_07685 [Firmicutes bacterium]|nr:hypothetical protein [Bacillota bacterium]
MDKENLKEKAIQDKDIKELGDEDLEKVAGGVVEEDEYYYQGAPDD